MIGVHNRTLRVVLSLTLMAVSALFVSPTHPASADFEPGDLVGYVPINGLTGKRNGVDGEKLNLEEAPTLFEHWPICVRESQEYCWEDFFTILEDGTRVSLDAELRYIPYVYCTDGWDRKSSTCKFDGSNRLEIGMRDAFATSLNLSEASTRRTYHWKLRTGKFSPDVTMMGDTKRLLISGNESDGWNVEIWASPTLKAHCYAQPCNVNLPADIALYQLQGFVQMLQISSEMSGLAVESEDVRDALRGAFISTNAQAQSWKFLKDTFKIFVSSPHLLPPGTTGKSEVAPGFVYVFLPGSYLTNAMGYEEVSSVTAGRVDLTLAGVDAVPAVVVRDGGLLIDTGVTHFSSPDPVLRVRHVSESNRVINTPSNSLPGTISSTTTSGSVASSNYVRTSASGSKATLIINLVAKQTVKIYRKVGTRLTLLKALAGVKGVNRFVTLYRMTYSFVVKDSKGKVIPPRVSSASWRLGLVSLR